MGERRGDVRGAQKVATLYLSLFPGFYLLFLLFILLAFFFFSPLIWTISVRLRLYPQNREGEAEKGQRARREQKREINTNYINPAEKPHSVTMY